MRQLILFLLVLSLAFAQCDVLLSGVETQYANYLNFKTVDCETQDTELIYSELAELAESYSYVAQCYKEEANLEKARAYYSLAAEKYFVAAEALCDTDYSLKMQLYMTSGDTYKKANKYEPAKVSYDHATHTYLRYNMQIDSSLSAELQKKIYELENPLAEDYQDVTNPEEVDWVPYVLVFLVFIGIALVILSLKKK